MPKGLSASTIKSWFQYRCERKVRYELSSDEELAAVPVAKDVREQAWAILGQDFEERVVDRLSRETSVLRPAPGDFGLNGRLAGAFLRGLRPETYAAQINLKTNAIPPFLEGTGLTLARTYPDLIRIERNGERLIFTIIDVKATRRATPFHKTQVAFYVRVLEALLNDLGVAAQISSTGEIWRIPDDGTAEGDQWQAEVFSLSPYLRLVDEFCRDVLPGIAAKQVRPGLDETFFHLYFKCEQCSFLEHCYKAIEPSRPPAQRDVSAVPGLTHEAKRTLVKLGRGSVAGLAGSPGFAQTPGIGWSLSRRAPALIGRAKSLLADAVARTEEKQTFLMPPRADAVILISVDQDPVDDRLAAIGYRLIQNGKLVREAVEVPASGSAKDEADAMAAVLGPLIDDLTKIDQANAQAQPGSEIYAHIFLYEPAEAINLQRAVGRHLEDPRIRGGLLHLVRLFPPEDIVPEPEFKGVHHLPATAVRSVVEQLYALPVAVSYDLRQVSGALAGTGGGPAYIPKDGFARPFSSLLSIEVIRNLRDGRPGAKSLAEISDDVRARLEALGGIIAWLFAENEKATHAGSPLLRLSKQPFRFQATFDPLNAVDLDVLLACELLENRAGLLETLIALSQPADRRRDAGRCYAGLSLVKHWQYGGLEMMSFAVPHVSQSCELGPGEFNLILTNDSPDLRLNPAMWGAVGCQIRPPNDGYESRRDLVLAAVPRNVFNAPTMQELLRTTGNGGWYIDQRFGDVNTAKAAAFLGDLAGAQP
jgi:hypothetical protein